MFESKNRHTWQPHRWVAVHWRDCLLFPRTGCLIVLEQLGPPLTDEQADVWLTFCADGMDWGVAVQSALLLLPDGGTAAVTSGP